MSRWWKVVEDGLERRLLTKEKTFLLDIKNDEQPIK